MKTINICILLATLWLVCNSSACRNETVISTHEEEHTGDSTQGDILGFYLLNEANMTSNKSTIDFYDYRTGVYTRNLYAEVNPNVTKELGDVGNDLDIYGARLYAVINCSNKVEVMEAATCRRIGQIDIPNCRYLAFDGPYGYITSYAGPVEIKPDYEQIGYVARFDTATLQIDAVCYVGFQPDDVAIVGLPAGQAGGKMYVANSGGYMVPNYENTLSVIDLASFKEVKRIPVAVNLHRLSVDQHGQLWVTNRGDYYDVSPKLYCLDTTTDLLTDSVDAAVSTLWLDGDSLYIIGSEFSYVTMQTEVTYGIVDVKTHRLLTDHFITDGTEAEISKPYGLAVNPLTKDIYVTDAKNYVTPGTLYCFGPDGVKKWSVRTGDIPAHFAFLYSN